MGDEQQVKKRKFPWKTSYSSMKSRKDIEKRIGITTLDLYETAITIKEMLALAGYSLDEKGLEAISTIKHEVYKELARYQRVGGHGTLVEANASDLALLTIVPIIDEFKQKTGRRSVRLFREKQIIFVDGETGGYEEFVVIDGIQVMKEKYILIIEAKRESLGAAMGQCLLAMKDMGDSNNGGVVYGFVTTGDSWRMLRYDASEGKFLVTNKIEAVFDTMGRDQEGWMSSYSVIVDCVYAALSDGGIVKKDLVTE